MIFFAVAGPTPGSVSSSFSEALLMSTGAPAGAAAAVVEAAVERSFFALLCAKTWGASRAENRSAPLSVFLTLIIIGINSRKPVLF